MNEYIMTFGYGQLYDGRNMDSHYYRIHADSNLEARVQAFELFDNQWCAMYDSEEEAGVQEFNLIELKI